MITNQYFLKARALPAAFSILPPILIFNCYFLDSIIEKFITEVQTTKLFGVLAVSVVIIIPLAEIGRILGKHVLEAYYFKKELNMPTVSFILHSDSTLSKEFKSKIRTKLLSDFKLTLPTENEEKNNPTTARIKIAEVLTLARKKVHANKFLLQHNIEYGMIRNILGGLLIGIPLSVFNVIFFYFDYYSEPALVVSYIFLGLYILLAVLNKFLLYRYGEAYAKIFYREYVTL